MFESLQKPLPLPPNRISLFYRGGYLIDQLRGLPWPRDDDRPEDWIGSDTALAWPGRHPDEGISSVDVDGLSVLLTDLVRQDPVGVFGPEHVARFGASSKLLVKLLDAGVRLPVHSHPDGLFAVERLGAANGKTEAWLVVDTRSIGSEAPHVLLGFSRTVPVPELLSWVESQDVERMIGALHRFEVHEGDAIYVPAGLPHAIGPGVCIVELQESSSLSVLMEHESFGVAASAAHLGLGWPTALQSVDRRSFTREELRASLIRSDTGRPAEIVDLFGVRSAPYFRGLRVRLGANGRVALDPAFAVHVVLDGEGRISAAAGSIDVRKGDQFLLTHAAKSTRIEAGDAGLDLVRALPPVPPRR